MKTLAASTLFAASFFASSLAHANHVFVTLVDDGTVEKSPFMTVSDEIAVQNKVLALYKNTGEALPEIMSVWTTFPLGGNVYATYFDPLGADVKGIGLEQFYPPDGTMTSP